MNLAPGGYEFSIVNDKNKFPRCSSYMIRPLYDNFYVIKSRFEFNSNANPRPRGYYKNNRALCEGS